MPVQFIALARRVRETALRPTPRTPSTVLARSLEPQTQLVFELYAMDEPKATAERPRLVYRRYSVGRYQGEFKEPPLLQVKPEYASLY